MLKWLCMTGLLFSSFVCAKEKISYFTPPENWQDADPKLLAPMVKMGYFGKGNTEFHPSINIAIEKIDDTSLKEYVKVVKKIHTSNRTTTWRNLGKFQTQAGKAQLTEITTKNQMGIIKMLQLIIVHEDHAYILTAAARKEEFVTFRNSFIKAFRSLKLTDDLFNELKDEKRKEVLLSHLHEIKDLCLNEEAEENTKKKKLLLFHSHLVTEYKDMGAYWQYLVLKQLHDDVVSQAM